MQFTPISFSVELTLLWFAIPKKISSSVHILALRGYATAPNSIASAYGLRQFFVATDKESGVPLSRHLLSCWTVAHDPIRL